MTDAGEVVVGVGEVVVGVGEVVVGVGEVVLGVGESDRTDTYPAEMCGTDTN
jgi:hypothetical protein